MAQSKTSKRWLQEHFDDPFVKQAQKDGYRSRASYKLLAIQERDRILKPGMTVLDLGSAPGGWSQVVNKKIKNGKILSIDKKKVNKIKDVVFIKGDFTEESSKLAIRKFFKSNIDVILSDMAPNTTGNKNLDSISTNQLCLEVLD